MMEQRAREAERALMSAKDDYRTRVQAVLTDIDKHMADLKARKPKTDKEKQDIQTRMDGLTKSRDALQKDLNRIEVATQKTWTDVKEEIDKHMKEAREAFAPPPGKI